MKENLCSMSTIGLPSSYLSCVVWAPSSEKVPTVPLKPASRILWMNPSLLAPHRQGLGRVDTKIIELWVLGEGVFLLELCTCEPIYGKLFHAIAHVDTTKDAKRQHFLGGELWLKICSKVSPHRLCQCIDIPLLHAIIHQNLFWNHVFFGGSGKNMLTRFFLEFFHRSSP